MPRLCAVISMAMREIKGDIYSWMLRGVRREMTETSAGQRGPEGSRRAFSDALLVGDLLVGGDVQGIWETDHFQLRLPRRLFLFGVGLALRAFLEIVVAAAAIGAAFGRRVGVEHRGHSQECTKTFPVAAIA